jgi:hypothetical protein
MKIHQQRYVGQTTGQQLLWAAARQLLDTTSMQLSCRSDYWSAVAVGSGTTAVGHN